MIHAIRPQTATGKEGNIGMSGTPRPAAVFLISTAPDRYRT